MISFIFNYTIVLEKNNAQKNEHLKLPQQLFKIVIDMPCSMFSIFKTNTFLTFVLKKKKFIPF
jgi:hypothetical protein